MKKENETIKSLIDKKDLSKSEVERLAQIIINDFDYGSSEPLEFLGRLEFMSQVIEKAKAEIREKALNELEKYGSEAKAGIKRFGIQFKIKETGVKYDYSNTSLWIQKKSQMDVINDELKSLEGQLKMISKPLTMVDEDSGEIITLYPPVKQSKTSIEITLPK